MRRTLLPTLLLALAVVGGLLAPREASSDASGCVLHENHHPAWNAQCLAEPGFNCYICEHTVDGETSVCSENPDGTIQFCKPQEEHQQDPPESG